MLVFKERGKLEYPEKKPLGGRTRTNNKLNPHMTLRGRIGGRRVLTPLRHPCCSTILTSDGKILLKYIDDFMNELSGESTRLSPV